MAKGKSQCVVFSTTFDYFECLTVISGLAAASFGACYDGDGDAARLPRESALFPGSSGAGAVAAASKRIVKIFHCQRLAARKCSLMSRIARLLLCPGGRSQGL
jgi:hypothetical protein